MHALPGSYGYNKAVKILFLAGREIGYQRNEVLLRALQRFSHVDVLAVKDRPKSILLNSLLLSLRAFPRLLLAKYDLVFVGFYGHLLMLSVGLFSIQTVLFDALLSTYDTVIDDRGVGMRGSLLAKLSAWLDVAACRSASRILLDTPEHIQYFIDQFELDSKNFLAIPVGCNEDLFHPRDGIGTSDCTRVVYYSSYLPLHGVDVVLKAAAQLKDKPIKFRLFGTGQTYQSMRGMAQQLDLRNVEFFPIVPINRIADEIAQADICLGGHFGATAKADRVVPGKVYQIIAMQRALIATATTANLDLLTHGVSAYLCPANNSGELAEGIRVLQADSELRFRLAVGGYRLYRSVCSEAIIAERIKNLVTEMLDAAL